MLLGAFAKLRKATIKFVTSVYLSVRIGQLGSHCTEFDETWYLSFSLNSAEKIYVSIKSYKNNGHFTGRRFDIFDDISLNSS
jgi:hypothetical protein